MKVMDNLTKIKEIKHVIGEQYKLQVSAILEENGAMQRIWQVAIQWSELQDYLLVLQRLQEIEEGKAR